MLTFKTEKLLYPPSEFSFIINPLHRRKTVSYQWKQKRGLLVDAFRLSLSAFFLGATEAQSVKVWGPQAD